MLKLRISFPNYPFLKEELLPLVALVSNKTEVSPSKIAPVNSFSGLTHLLSANELDVGLFPLHLIPPKKQADIVIGALAHRKKTGLSLLIKKEKLKKGNLLQLPETASVGVFSEMERLQILSFRADIKGSFFSMDDFESVLAADAFVFPSAWVSFFENDYETIDLNATEMIPAAGTGVIAFVCRRNDLDIRRLLKSVHQPKVSALTNVERAIERDALFPTASFCSRDEMNHFHVYSVGVREGELLHVNCSSSTSVGLVERVIGEFAASYA